jgi:hypothetical protein
MIGGLPECDTVGCKAIKRDVNNWWVVFKTSLGVHLYKWDNAPQQAMTKGKHFCGIAHMLDYVSYAVTPDETNAKRESTLVLKPPLSRDGSEPIEAEEPNIDEE